MTQPVNSQLIDVLNWRYAVKRFDPERKIPSETWQAIEDSLVLTPSSYGLQPWRFVVVTNQSIKDQLPAVSWNQGQPRDCSHMVVLAAKEQLDEAYIDRFLEHTCAVRGLAPDAMAGYRSVLVSTIQNTDSHLEWNARQVYIALGQLMLAAAIVGVDTCPMEGINATEYDRLLGLTEAGFRTVVGCAVGYRHPEDAQALAKKVRFAAADVIQRV